MKSITIIHRTESLVFNGRHGTTVNTYCGEEVSWRVSDKNNDKVNCKRCIAIGSMLDRSPNLVEKEIIIRFAKGEGKTLKSFFI